MHRTALEGANNEVASDNVLRSLGPHEEYSVIRHQLGIYLNVCVTAAYAMEMQHSSVKSKLYNALAIVIRSHPILGAALASSNDGGTFFQRLQYINLDHVVTFQRFAKPAVALSEGGLDHEIGKQHNSAFNLYDTTVPCWRVHVFSDPDDHTIVVSFCFAHAMIDTKSALVFLEDLETAMSAASEETAETLVSASCNDINPPLHTMIALKSSRYFFERQRNMGEPPPHVWSGGPQTIPSTTRFNSMWLSCQETSDLQFQCKLQNTTFTALLMAILARSCFEALGPDVTVLHGDCAISLLRFFSERLPPRSMGCYVTGCSVDYHRSTASIWEDARSTKLTIDSVLERRGSDSSASFIGCVPDLTAWLLEKQGTSRWPAWELSNVGTLAQPNGETSSIQSLLFSQSSSACAGALKVSVASGRDRRASLGFSYQAGIVDDALIKRIQENMRKWIRCIQCS